MEQIKEREKQLLSLGFKRNDHQRCFHQYKYSSDWTFDFWDVEELDDTRWSISVENYKKYLQEAKTELESDELYLLGVKSAEKRIKQQILDLKNKYKSNLQQETHIKLNKEINKDRVNELLIKLSVIEEIEKTLEE